METRETQGPMTHITSDWKEGQSGQESYRKLDVVLGLKSEFKLNAVTHPETRKSYRVLAVKANTHLKDQILCLSNLHVLSPPVFIETLPYIQGK